MKKFGMFAICSLLLFTGCGKKKEEEMDPKKFCCLQYGGRWENNDCASSGVNGVEFDYVGYKNCVNASKK